MNIFDEIKNCKGCKERQEKINEYMRGLRDRLRGNKPDPRAQPPIKNFGAAVPPKVDKPET